VRKSNLFSGLLILLGCAFLIFAGCSSVLTEDAAGPARSRTLIDDPPPVFNVPVSLVRNVDGPKYYDLATGQQVNPKVAPWDFGVEYQWEDEALKGSGLVFFYTNSGDSGAGLGGVWFTDMTDFSLVQLSDKIDDFSDEWAEYAPYVTDTIRYAQGMSYAVYETPMNMMTYFGFPEGGDGLTEETPFEIIPYEPPDPISQYKFYCFNKMAAYTDKGDMPPELLSTGQVYIIAHHGGAVYSKLQVNAFALDPTTLNYSMTLTFTEVE
jgi:hypothetical protein